MDTAIRRIAVAEVEAAREKTGYSLETGVTISCGYGCPIGVLAVAAGVDRGYRGEEGGDFDVIVLGARLGLDEDYASGFVDGWDRGHDRALSVSQAESWNVGYADGLACRKAFLEGDGTDACNA